MKSTLVVDQLTVLSDAIRVRMLSVLEGRELTVSELCDIVQLPQSTVSRHLKTLADGDWVTSRRDGTSRLYTLPLDDVEPRGRNRYRYRQGHRDGAHSGFFRPVHARRGSWQGPTGRSCRRNVQLGSALYCSSHRGAFLISFLVACYALNVASDWRAH